jgi:hypothetical protein
MVVISIGIIRKLGQKAAICTAFNVFSVTVYPENEAEVGALMVFFFV